MKKKPSQYQHSITKRLFFNISIIVLTFAIVVVICNALFLRPLYAFYTERVIEKAIKDISKINFKTDENEWRTSINTIERNNHFEILIFEDQRMIYSTSMQPRWVPTEFPTDLLNDLLQFLDDKPQNNNNIENINNAHPSRHDSIIYSYTKIDNYTILVTQILSPVNNTIRQTNLVILLVTTIFLLITLFLAFRLSKRFTSPIREIQSTVADIMDLNFNATCDVSTGDELEHLADDVNELSLHLKETLNQLHIQNEQLEKDILSQRQFISNASHELRTPLSLIKGYADEIGNGFVNDAKQQNLYINIISEEANKMNRLLKEMLDLSRMESGRMTLDLHAMPINQLIQDFVDKYDGYISDHQLNLSLALAAENPIGSVDTMRFEQILANYLSNAAKYGDDQHQVIISTHIKPDVVRIALFNSGSHISDQTLANIWDRFYKRDQSRSQNEGSYGLGLSIVAAIQALSGQHYGVENVDGGVNFWFEVWRVR